MRLPPPPPHSLAYHTPPPIAISASDEVAPAALALPLLACLPQVVSTLQAVARRGRIVITSLHQPSPVLFNMLDQASWGTARNTLTLFHSIIEWCGV
jgi:hypothetical protein